MKDKMSFNFCTFAFILYIRAVYTVVPEYCTQPFNRDDCGMQPIPVFKYWKPGSRCEIDYWRGCPTANMFPDVYNCTLTCIFKISNFIEDTLNECETPLNRDTCMEKQKHKIVFTYENGACVERIWEGCPSLNRFDTKAECMTACAEDNWNAKLQNLNIEQLKEIDNILDGITETPATETVESSNESGSEKSSSDKSSGSGKSSGSDKSSESDKNSGSEKSSESNETKSSSNENSGETTKKDSSSQETETTTFVINQIGVLTT